MSANPQPPSRLQEWADFLAGRPESPFLEKRIGQRFLTEAGDLLARSFGKRYRGAILFGSQARGDAVPESDLDLLVLLESPIHLVEDLRTIHRALEVFDDSGKIVIQGIPVDWREFEKQGYHFYRKIRNEGIRL